MPDRINDVGVTGAACCTFLLQYYQAFNAGLTLLVSLLTLVYVALRVYREYKKINFYKKKGKRHVKVK